MTQKKRIASRSKSPVRATPRDATQWSKIEAEIAALNEKMKRTLPELQAQADRLLNKH